MKEIKLTRGYVTQVDNEDFEHLSQFKWFAHRRGHSFYATRKLNGKQVSMHRYLLGVTELNILVDHKDRNTLNNQKDNLRPCTRSQNNANSASRKNSTSKYMGVCFYKHSKKWRANIGKDGKIYHIGFFNSEEEAALAYNQKAKELHGEFANLNIIS